MRYILLLFTFLYSGILYSFPQQVPLECLVEEISASSYLIEKRYSAFSYHPVNAFDNETRTAWFEGVTGNGIGEYIELTFLDKIDISKISILNGYTKSKKLFNANGRVRLLELTVNDHKKSETFELNDTIKNQDLILNFKNVKKIRFTIKSVYSGLKYNDVGLTELTFSAAFSNKLQETLTQKQINSIFDSMNNAASFGELKNGIKDSFKYITRKQLSNILARGFSMLDGSGNIERNYAIPMFLKDYPRLIPVLLHTIYSRKKSFYFTRSESIYMEAVQLLFQNQTASIPFIYHVYRTDPNQSYGALAQLLIIGDTRAIPKYLQLLNEWEGEWEGDPIYQDSPHIILKKNADQYLKNRIRKFLKKKDLPKKLSNELKKIFMN